jgi:hypothetical protein
MCALKVDARQLGQQCGHLEEAVLFKVEGLPEPLFVLAGQISAEDGTRRVRVAELEDLMRETLQFLGGRRNIKGQSFVVLVLGTAVSPCSIPVSATATISIAVRVPVGRQ